MSDSPIIGFVDPFPEAPDDGVQYGRQSKNWTPVVHTDAPEGLPEEVVDQPAHGFVVGDAIYFDGTTYKKAIATAANTVAHGVVVAVDGADAFTWTLSGQYDIGAHGLTVGEWYFLSASSPGKYQAAPPAIEQPILLVRSATEVSIYSYRPNDASGSDFITEAPEDGTLYGRMDAAWSRVPDTLPDAPADNALYGRQNRQWVEVAGVKITQYVSDTTSDAKPTVHEAWNDFADRQPVTRLANELIFFNWPSGSPDNYQYIGTQLVAPWTSTAQDWISLGGTVVSWGDIIGNIDDQTDLNNALIAKGAVGIDYTFQTAIDATDPGNGGIRLNNADPAAATEMYVSAFSGLGNQLTRYWNGFQKGDLLKLLEVSGDRSFASFEITTSPVNNTSWFTVGISNLELVGNGFAAGGAVQIYWSSDPRSTVREGGTAGQILSKADGNDFNQVWVDPFSLPNGSMNDILVWDGANWVPDQSIYAKANHNHDGTYAPVSHTHVKADITDFAHTHEAADLPATMPPSAHTHVKADITDFAHTHVVADITDFPATMPPSAHTHVAADLPTVLVGVTSIEVVAALPATPVATTLYIVTG